ncbi:hypothetical protein ACFL14_02520 [Patescibacteria group bacterium]
MKKNLTIAFDARPITQKPSGVGIYLMQILDRFVENEKTKVLHHV